MSNSSPKKSILLFINLLLIIPVFAAGYHGKVFIDQNRNGKWDHGEKGLLGVLVSNGLQVVKTDQAGNYMLSGPVKNHFIFITIPNGYTADPFYHEVVDGDSTNDFALRQRQGNKKRSVSFVQITDTETWEYGEWIDNLKDYVRNEHPDFIIHTGDICYDKGLHFHHKNINTETMGTPLFYCIGNHDLLKGDYGEQTYEQLFGPVYYSFDAGNVHFIVTPMLSGDYKPSYTKSDVYHWMKNDLSMVPKNKSVIIFNHDLLSNVNDQELLSNDRFIYAISDSQKIDLNNHHLIAWVYGHWHTALVKKHGAAGILSICSSPPDKGGIDHSISAFRAITVNDKGKVKIDTRYSYQDHHLAIAAPGRDMTPVAEDGSINIIANTYHSAAPVSTVRYALQDAGKKTRWSLMEQRSSWSWYADWKPADRRAAKYQLTVESILTNGDTITQERSFTYDPSHRVTLRTGDPWPVFLQNPAHHPNKNGIALSKMQLAWVANAGAPIYMASTVIADGLVFTATNDEGNLDEGKIIALHAADGQISWKYETGNAVKGSIAFTEGKVFAVDVAGILYALNAHTGKLTWKKTLDRDYLPADLQGVIAAHDTIFAGAGKGLYALRAGDGKEIWHNASWDRSDGSTANQTLAGKILIGSANWSALFANDARTGKLLWSRNDEGLRFRDAAVSFYKGKLYATGGTKFFELNPQTGKDICTKELAFGASGVKSASAPLVTDKAVIFGTANKGIVALDNKSLAIKWRFPTGKSLFYTAPYTKPPAETVETSPVKLGSYIFFGASDGKIYLLNETTGQPVWQVSVGAPIVSTAAISGNMAVVADYGGNIYAFEMLQ